MNAAPGGMPPTGGPMPPTGSPMPPTRPLPGLPPGAPMGAPPIPPPAMGPGPGSPLKFAFTDLPSDMTDGWQILDVASRLLKAALRTPDFQKTPTVAAAITSLYQSLNKLISHYASNGDGSSGMPSGVSSDTERGGDAPDTTDSDVSAEPGE